MQESEKGEKGHQKIQGKRREHEEPEDPGSREQHAMSGSHKPHKETSVVGSPPLCNTFLPDSRLCKLHKTPQTSLAAASSMQCQGLLNCTRTPQW